MTIFLEQVKILIKAVPQEQHHPGLALDKHTPPPPEGDKSGAKKADLDKICKIPGDNKLLEALHARRKKALDLPGALSWSATTVAPLSLHLARATALENAGIALHPVYGFAYMPGSGLKGLARAYAETIWLDREPNREAAAHCIRAVFGWAPDSDKNKNWLAEANQAAIDDSACAGQIVFHDAWPCQWPRLMVDVATVHHPKYYQAAAGKVPPPGDWEEPNPITFLAVKPGTAFSFVLTARASCPNPALVAQAKQWLDAALRDLGAGAKTAAGYGLFKTAAEIVTPGDRRRAAHTLTLVTPAFLAGAAPGDKDDCTLRGATLRGQLRWWWRTLHAGHLDPETLRKLEAAVWGDTSAGGAVRLSVEAAKNSPPEQFTVDPKFLRKHGIAKETHGSKTVQGIKYSSYGAGPEGRKPARWYCVPGSSWQLQLSARPSIYPPDADTILRQAQAALWLLCQHGGVGAKSRKGFGSFADIAVAGITSVEDCQKLASQFRQTCGLGGTSAAGKKDAPSLDHMTSVKPIPIAGDVYFVLDRVGAKMQEFAQQYKHQPVKAALGLPRKIDRNTQLGVKIPVPLSPRSNRHAAPVLYHVGKAGESLYLRVVAFSVPHFPDSEQLFEDLVAHIETLRKPIVGPAQSPTPGGRVNPVARQYGTDLESEEEVEVLETKGDQLRVRYLYDDKEADIPKKNFRPGAK